MRSAFILIFTIASISNYIFAQGYEIKVNINDYYQEELYLANHFGDNQFVKDTVKINTAGDFIFKGEEPLNPGMYMIVMAPENDIFQILVDKEQHFEIKTNRDTPAQSIGIMGSQLNVDFYEYLNFLGRQRLRMDDLETQIQAAEEAGDNTAYNQLVDQFNALNSEVVALQNQIINEQDSSLLSKIIKANIDPELPDFSKSPDPAYDQFIFVKKHWFDNIDLADPCYLYTPILFEKVDYYMQKLTYQIPDSVIVAVDYILEMVKPAEASYKFFLIHFLNKYAASNIVGMDAVYVHIGEKYFSKENTPWAETDQLEKILDNVARLKPLLIGKNAPDLKLQIIDIEKTFAQKDNPNEKERSVSKGEFLLKSLDADYIVLFVWAPNCPHCKASLPFLKDFYNQWKDRGVEVVALCNSIYKNTPACAEYLRENEMLHWVNAMDPYVKSKYKQLYDVRTIPQLYVIDRSGKIVMKKIETEQLNAVMEEIVGQ